MNVIIETKNFTKLYDKAKAVNNLNLTVKQGEFFGFLGPNGAGKSTTIRVMTTLTKPSSGTITINGFDVVKEPLKVKELIGVVQQHLTLDGDLSLGENMELIGRLRRIKKSERKKRIQELLDYTQLADQTEKMVNKLSGGMQKKASIACGLIHNPKILFLDEPTVGLDAQTRRRLWDFMRQLNSDGTTIFLTTHYIEEAQALCDRVGIMHQGQLKALGTPLQLQEKLGEVCVETLLENKQTHYQYFTSQTAAEEYIQSLPTQTKTVVRNSNLEDVFVELIGQKVNENGNIE